MLNHLQIYTLSAFKKDIPTTNPDKLLISGSRRAKYKGKFYSISATKRSTNKGKKYMVEVSYKDGDKIRKKKVHWGAKGYSDYTKHKDEARRKRFQKRHKAIKTKSGEAAHKNPLQPSYYATKYNW